jgi:hypothetical protein
MFIVEKGNEILIKYDLYSLSINWNF